MCLPDRNQLQIGHDIEQELSEHIFLLSLIIIIVVNVAKTLETDIFRTVTKMNVGGLLTLSRSTITTGLNGVFPNF